MTNSNRSEEDQSRCRKSLLLKKVKLLFTVTTRTKIKCYCEKCSLFLVEPLICRRGTHKFPRNNPPPIIVFFIGSPAYTHTCARVCVTHPRVPTAESVRTLSRSFLVGGIFDLRKFDLFSPPLTGDGPLGCRDIDSRRKVFDLLDQT